MYAKQLIPILLLPAVLVSCGGSDGLNPGVWNAYRNPVEQSDVQDPCAIEDDGVFYLFSSEVSSGSGADQVVEYLPTMTSPNLTEWSVGRSVFDDISKPSFISGSKISCPDIAFVGGKYLLYYTLSSSSATGIGVAEADFASGPFTDKGALITSSASGLTGVASPSFVTDGTSNYLAFG
ncbi:MAG: family 43 glycosylhydrolase, partial [Bacteroidales bacterium]|nr:family 43 glycosylhydrolase [Bacteroidales bacterium]